MPKIRDLGISVIPVTMRPAEIGGGAADFEYWAQKTPCQPTDPASGPPECKATPDDQCCPTNDPFGSGKEEDGTGLPHDTVVQLKQQLHDQINAELLN